MVGDAILDEEGELLADSTWAPSCFDFSTPEGEEIGDAYVNYAAWMAEVFQPA
ncbi:MAG: hypothetical protein U5K56_16990 [Halioglobus sp.]|nr:hypothetical protein [Halioglobus sp.]